MKKIEYYIATSRCIACQFETESEAKAFILKQREKFKEKCPTYKLIERVVTYTEKELLV